MKKILVTDSLFIFEEHVQQLEAAGFEVERLDKPEASEDELVETVKEKAGYILGGVEQITDNVINSGTELKAIVFTGADWRHFIPGFKLATEKGIHIANTPAANAFAVAEYTMTTILSMIRNTAELTRTGKATFQTTESLKDKTVGIVGMGNIGTKVAEMLQPFGVNILYFSRTRKEDLESTLSVKYTDLETLLQNSDIVTLHVSKEVGEGYMDGKKMDLMKDNSLLVNCGFTGCVDHESLYVKLSAGRIRAFEDGPADDRFNQLPLSIWNCSNSHTAFNTYEANKKASDMAVSSIINLLKDGKDSFKVN